MIPITIRSFRAVREPEVCCKFYEGHVNALRSYGVEPISSASERWISDPEVYGVIAESGDRVLGGVKVHRYSGTTLPIEEGIGYLDDRIYNIIKTTDHLGELCGLWNAKEVAGTGLSYVLLRAMVVITDQLNVHNLISLSSDHTIKMLRGLGYRVVHSLGDNGNFLYPTKEYIARVMACRCKTLSWASPYNKEAMLALREKPIQTRKETGPKGEIEINYKLALSA